MPYMYTHTHTHTHKFYTFFTTRDLSKKNIPRAVDSLVKRQQPHDTRRGRRQGSPIKNGQGQSSNIDKP
jgi:hypothetical protein